MVEYTLYCTSQMVEPVASHSQVPVSILERKGTPMKLYELFIVFTTGAIVGGWISALRARLAMFLQSQAQTRAVLTALQTPAEVSRVVGFPTPSVKKMKIGF